MSEGNHLEDEPVSSGNTPEEVPKRSAAEAVGIDLDKGQGSGDGPTRGGPGSRGKGVIITLVVAGLVLLLGVAFFRGPSGSHLDFVAPEGEKAPDFELATIYGDQVSMEGLRGKPVFLNFWASWCGPCKDEAPVLADAYRRWKGSGIQFLGMDESDSIKWARQFEEYYGIEYDSAFDPTGKQYFNWGITGYPETFFVDADGNILAKKIGAFYEQAEIDEYLSILAPNFTPEPPGELVIPEAPSDIPESVAPVAPPEVPSP